MKTVLSKCASIIILLMAVNAAMPLMASQDEDKLVIVSGLIKDNVTKRPLASANITVPGTNIGTVANAEGKFSLKLPAVYKDKTIEVSHIGYHNSSLPLSTTPLSGITIWMKPYSNLLNEIIVYSNNPRQIVEEAISKIAMNYSDKNNMLTAFYRETVQKRNRYISISEALIDIFKTPYAKRSIDRDRVQVLKGRKLLSQNRKDTLSVKLAGGPYLSIFMDVIKNQNLLLNKNDLTYYDFWIEDPVSIDNRLQIVIGFRPRIKSEIALLYGKLYIDRQQLALSRAEFNLDLTDKVKAVSTILLKKPMGLRFHPQEMRDRKSVV